MMTGESRSEALAPTRLFLVRSTAGQRQQDAPIKRPKTYLEKRRKNVNNCTFQLSFKIR